MEVTMSREEYKALETQRDEAVQECAELRKRLKDAETADPSGKVPLLLRCIEAALPIVKFAVGNLDPHTVRNWPYDELATFAAELEKAPGADTGMQAAAHEFRSFIRDAQEIEAGRQRRDAVKTAK